MLSSLCPKGSLSSCSSSISTSLGNFSGSNLQTPCRGFQPRTRVAVCEFQGQTAESDTKSPEQLTPKERRKLRNERREALKEQKGNWKEEVENKLDVKKRPPRGWVEILDLNRLASKGYVWYMCSVPKKAEHVAAEQLDILFAEKLPGMKYQALTPSVPSLRKLKSGRYSDARQRLYPGCLFIRCVMDREVYNVIRSNPRIYDFFGTKAQGTSVSNMIIPAAVSIIEMDELFLKMERAEAEFKVLKEVADREADEMERLEREAIEAEGHAPPPPALERGALVRIKAGPFTNHTATVSDIDYDAETLQLSVIIFGRPTAARLRIDEVTVLEGAR